jgi:hypothetical protein
MIVIIAIVWSTMQSPLRCAGRRLSNADDSPAVRTLAEPGVKQSP